MVPHPALGSVIPRLLVERGIDTVFGIPGVHTVELYRGLPGSGLRHVTPRHEQGAGFMADGYARASGRPAACFIITGPGLLNIATAMAQALADSIPMLVVITSNSRATLGRGEGRLHELRGQSVVAREISVFHAQVLTASQLVPALDEAFAILSSARPGPVVIELPIDLLSEPFDMPIEAPAPRPAPPAPAAEAIAQAAAILDGAARPLLIAGGGAVNGAATVRALAEALDAPTLLTINAKGILPPDHPLLVGGCLPLPPIRSMIRDADAVLAIGTELGETDFEYYGEGPLEFSGLLLRVDVDARQLSRNARPALPIVGDAGLAAAALLPLVTRRDGDGGRRARLAREASLAHIEPRLLRHRALLDTIWRVLPGAVVAGDSTVPSYAGNLYGTAPAPRRWMSAATGFGTLGYALPAAIGAKLARPDAAVVSIIGDGGLHFTLPELASASDAGAPVIVLLWNDRRYGEIEDFMVRGGIEPLGVRLHATDFAAAAAAFGARHVRADGPAAVARALADAARAGASTIIEMDASHFVS
jgi:acetolactate synthase I/II/III large subunit